LAGAFVCQVINRDLVRVEQRAGCQAVKEVKSDVGIFALPDYEMRI